MSAPDFLIVGSPRSGTTLVQRLTNGLEGVRVPPETHFFTLYAPSLLRRRQFPLATAALRAEIAAFRELPTSRELTIDAEAVIGSLGGACERPVDLFGALVHHLAGDAEVVGEKTPHHLRWWRPLVRALPGLRFVAVVRDPRAVVASHLAVPFGMSSHVLAASSWALDQRELVRLGRALGEDRVLVLRYEAVVHDPNAAQTRLSRFLDRPPSVGAGDEAMFASWERPWKERAAGAVTAERVESWRDVLSERQVAEVLAVCGTWARRLGYASAASSGAASLRVLALGPRDLAGLVVNQVGVRTRVARDARRRL